MAALTALGCLTWWLVEGGTRGAEIAGDLAAPAGVIAAAAAIWPFLRPGVPAGRPARTIPKGQISTMATSPASAQAPRRLRTDVPGSGAPPVRRSGQVVLWGPRASGKRATSLRSTRRSRRLFRPGPLVVMTWLVQNS